MGYGEQFPVDGEKFRVDSDGHQIFARWRSSSNWILIVICDDFGFEDVKEYDGEIG